MSPVPGAAQISARVVRLIRNPISGGADAGRLADRVRRLLARAGFEAIATITDGPGHARELAAAAGPETAAVVAAGGDGTVREVADGLAGRAVPLAVFPVGTENLFARWAGWPREPEDWVSAFVGGHAASIDLGRATDAAGGTGRYFALLAGVGFDAEALVRLNRIRRGHISRLTYVSPILRTAGSYRWPPLRVVADGKTVSETAGIVVIANINAYALGLPVVPAARPDDGLLDATIFECGSVWRLGVHALFTAMNRHIGRPGVQAVRAARFEVSSPVDVGWELDGDPFGRLPAVFEAVPDALRARVPGAIPTRLGVGMSR